MGKGKKLHPREKKAKLKKIEKLQLSLLLCKGTNASKYSGHYNINPHE